MKKKINLAIENPSEFDSGHTFQFELASFIFKMFLLFVDLSNAKATIIAVFIALYRLIDTKTISVTIYKDYIQFCILDFV